MKKLLSTLAVTALVYGCANSGNSQDITLSVLNDITDTHALRCKPLAILKLFNLAEDQGRGATFRYAEITDRKLTPVTVLQLAPDTGAESTEEKTPFAREKSIMNFYDTVTRTILGAREYRSRDCIANSECYAAICAELHVLAKANSTRKILLVFSNLMENSAIASLYSSKTNSLLRKNPEQLQLHFEQAGLLPDSLQGITVVFLYLPLNRTDDIRYNALVSRVYRPLLEKRNATVVVQASVEINLKDTHFKTER